MTITVTELKSNVDHYLDLVEKETVFISENGRCIAILSSVDRKKLDLLDSLRGIIPYENKTMKEYRAERISGRYSFQ